MSKQLSRQWTIVIQGGHGQNVDVRSGNGRELQGKVDLDSLDKEIIDTFEDLARKGRLNRRELQVLGKLLYKAIFNGDIEKILDENANEGRVLLHLQFAKAASSLSILPWEFLYRPIDKGGYFLTSRADLVLSRYTPPSETIKRDVEEGTVKVLVVASRPKELVANSPDKTSQEIDKIIETIRKATKSSNIHLDIAPLSNSTLSEFLKAVEHHKPHVIHYIGHGKHENEDSYLSFAAQGNKEKHSWCSSETFATCFQRVHPRLVFLHLRAALTGSEYLKASFASVAPKVILQDVGAVVAMQYPLRSDHGELFVEQFYEQLAQGESVGTAVQEARRIIYLDETESVAFAAPVLFAHINEELRLCKKAKPKGKSGPLKGLPSSVPPPPSFATVPGETHTAPPTADRRTLKDKDKEQTKRERERRREEENVARTLEKLKEQGKLKEEPSSPLSLRGGDDRSDIKPPK